ncbi:MAG: hydrolase [Sideroxydans sp. GWF2_59_14]|nr:MAG: hydrolase [Sideroxydans sp. GWF2_59_14]HAF45537.1 alpha/beta hydrolase [Gallionellaceae bacterium]
MSTWVLLRGLMREARHWGDFPAQFQKITGAQKVVTLDFPGNGSLHAQASPTSVAGMAESCRSQLERLGHRPPYNVLALSLGAMVAVSWSERHPQELGRMVLINTSLAPYNPFYQRMRPRNYPGLLRFLVFNSIPARERSVLHITSNKQCTVQQRTALLEQWESYAGECPVSRTNILRQLSAAATFRAAPVPPPVPVLLLSGKQDHLVNVKCSLTLAQRWRCEIRLHPTAGHDIPLDDGEWVAKQVKDWLVA